MTKFTLLMDMAWFGLIGAICLAFQSISRPTRSLKAASPVMLSYLNTVTFCSLLF